MAQVSQDQQDSMDSILDERGSKYGEFERHASITQSIKRAMADSPNWSILDDSKKEALEMVAHKIARIVNGDPDYLDSWDDIEGYVRCASKVIRRSVETSSD